MKVFISYGKEPQKYVDVVKRFKEDLEQNGYKAWIGGEFKKLIFKYKNI